MKDMWKRILGFIIKMTSGVVYSIVMHSVIITAYALVISRTFYTRQYGLDELSDVCGPIIFSYLPFVLVEVGVRWIYNEDPLMVTKSGHLAHFIGCFMLFAYMIPSNPIEALVYYIVGPSLVFGTFFVLLAFVILPHLEDESLTQPFV